MQDTKKLQDLYKRWCHIQKNAGPSEAIQARKQATLIWTLYIKQMQYADRSI